MDVQTSANHDFFDLFRLRTTTFWRTKDIYSKLSSVEDYGISEVTWCRHIVEALELRPKAALSEGAIMKGGKVRRRSRKRKKFHFI